MITTILSGLAFLIGFFMFKKGKSATALLENLKTKQDLNVKDKEIAKNEGALESEEEKRAEIEKKANEEKSQDLTNEELANFFKDKK